jgi:hypothetical protein
MEKRYNVYREHCNYAYVSVFMSDDLATALRYIADNIDGVTYPSLGDNTTNNLYCYHLYDGCKTEDDGEGNMIPSEIFLTDEFYGD